MQTEKLQCTEEKCMRRATKKMELFLLELKRNCKMFLFYMMILGLLFSVISAVFELAGNIPNELYRQMEDTDLATITIDKVTIEDMDYLDEMDIYIWSYTDWENPLFIDKFSIAENKKDIGEAREDGGIAHWNGKKSHEPLQINKKLIAGSKWNKETEQGNGIWMEDKLAKVLGVNIGSEIEYINHEGKKNGNLVVKGIYQADEMLFGFYIPVAQYVQLEELTSYLTVDAKPLEVRELWNIVKTLEKKNFTVSYCKSDLESVQFVVYLLYGTNLLLIITVVCILSDFIRIYCGRRELYFGMLMSFGMCYSSLNKVILYYVECLLGGAVLISIWGSKFFYRYITKYINELFTDLLQLEKSNYENNFFILIAFGMFAFLYITMWIRYMKNIEVDKVLLEEQ